MKFIQIPIELQLLPQNLSTLNMKDPTFSFIAEKLGNFQNFRAVERGGEAVIFTGARTEKGGPRE